MSVEWDRASEYWTEEERRHACEDCCKGSCAIHNKHKKDTCTNSKSNAETLKGYWVSDAHWDGNELEVTLSPTSQAKYTVRLCGDTNTDKIFDLMRDRNSPVRDFVLDKDNKTLSISPNIAVNIISVKNEGR